MCNCFQASRSAQKPLPPVAHLKPRENQDVVTPREIQHLAAEFLSGSKQLYLISQREDYAAVAFNR